MAVDESETLHLLLGGSSANRWVKCYDSILLSKDLPPQIPGERAILGTKAHALAEKAVESMLLKKLTGSGTPGFVEEFNAEEDTDIKEAVLRYCELIWERVLGEFITDKAYGIEDFFVLDENLQMGGTADFWAVYRDNKDKRVLAIVDFKYGYNPVEATSAQFILYACAARKHIRDNFKKDIDYARCVVIQPPNGEENDYHEVKYTSKQLDTWETRFRKAGEAIVIEKKSKAVTGEHCKYCRAQAVCKKYTKELSTSSLLQVVNIEKETFPAPETLPLEHLAKLLQYRKQIEAYLKNCAKYALEIGTGGGDPAKRQKIPGMKIVRGASKRAWVSNHDVIAKDIEKQHGIKAESLFKEPQLKGLGEVKTILSEYLGIPAKAADSLIDGYTAKPEGKLSIVPEDDKKPEIDFEALSLLKVENEEMIEEE